MDDYIEFDLGKDDKNSNPNLTASRIISIFILAILFDRIAMLFVYIFNVNYYHILIMMITGMTIVLLYYYVDGYITNKLLLKSNKKTNKIKVVK